MIKEVKGNELYFSRVEEDVIKPSRKSHNAGYDIYAYFVGTHMIIMPNETRMIPTGLRTACNENYYIQLVERGSTGTKGIGQRCGVIDSSYRGEWFVPLTNHGTKPIIIAKDDFIKDNPVLSELCIVYSYSKAICQAVVLPVPKMELLELSEEELTSIPSERGEGCIGSSGK